MKNLSFEARSLLATMYYVVKESIQVLESELRLFCENKNAFQKKKKKKKKKKIRKIFRCGIFHIALLPRSFSCFFPLSISISLSLSLLFFFFFFFYFFLVCVFRSQVPVCIMRLVVIGGVAAGASAATKARRVSEACKITIFEAGPFVSFANCGLPYFIGGDIAERSKLLLNDAASFKRRFNIDVHVNHKVVKIHRQERTVIVQRSDGSQFSEPYDSLIIATGAGAIMPWSNAKAAKNVFCVKSVPDADAIKAFLVEGRAKSAIVIGGGFIGVEVAEALMHAKLDEVRILEMAPHILPGLDDDIASEMQAAMVDAGIKIKTGDRVAEFVMEGERAIGVKLESGARFDADLFIVGLGVRANVELAKDCGLQIGQRNGIVVDEFQQTSDPHIWAAGCFFIDASRRSL